MITLSAKGGGDSKAYLSLPTEGEPPRPSVVVIHEWWGLNQHIKHWSDRLAEAGYAALAVDLYGGEVATNPDEAMKLMKAVDPEAALATLRAALTYLGEAPETKATERASIGWCFGGKWSLELALAEPELDAAVVYYGHVETSPERLSKLEAPLLAIFGNQDKGIPPEMVDRFEFGLEQAGDKRYTIKRYDAQHAFANPSSERYDQKAASAAWAEVQAFLKKELVER
ncbi:MAG TPA: dienelactone hydrolase family protein [Polyangiaceae bacterium]|nr:dienelactone hydrolase family protein [Polyangiaceae bacterium]